MENWGETFPEKSWNCSRNFFTNLL